MVIPKDTVSEKVSQVGKLSLVMAFFLLPLNALRPTAGATYGDLFLIVALAIAVLLIVLRKEMPTIPWWLWAGGITLVVSALLVQVFPPDSVAALERSFPWIIAESSISSFLKLLFACVVLPVVVSILIRDRGSIRLLASAWIAGVSVSCLVAFLDAYIGTGLQLSLAFDEEVVRGFLGLEPARYFGLTVHPVALGLTAAITTPLVLSRMTDWRQALIYLPVFLLLVFGVLLSGTRAALVEIVVASVLTLAWIGPVRRTIFAKDPRTALTFVAGGLVTVAIIMLAAPAQPYSDVTGYKGGSAGPATIVRIGSGDPSAEESNADREQTMKASVEYTADRPLTGYGFRWLTASHNIYLQLLLSGGILALVGYLLAVIGYLKTGFSLRNTLPRSLQDLARALTIAAVIPLLNGIGANPISDRYLYLPVGLIMAIWAMKRAERTGEEVPASET